jgi:tRNA A-37 threonylcarbamoyl transferase component Bud32
MVSDSEESEDDANDDLLRQWEERIDGAGDPAESLADLLSGRQAGRHRLYSLSGTEMLGCLLGRILGAGGMGVTYAATKDGERVAVKLVPSVVGATRERFEQECRVLRDLQHAAIVRYREHTVTDDEVGVLVMDLVDGLDLEQLLAELHRECSVHELHPLAQAMAREISTDGGDRMKSPRLWRRILRMLSEVADGLHCAHQRGVVHRDVKPANILVGPDLAPVLIDFGLARDALNRVSFTQSGLAMGTLAYMAPEQLGRDPGAVDRRADVYALGLILYRAYTGVELRELIGDVVSSGRRPFLLSSRQSAMLPADVQAILYRALDPSPASRYSTAEKMASDLRAAAGHGDLKARVPSVFARLLRDRQRSLGAATGLLVLCLLIAWWLWPRGREVLFVANYDGLASIVLQDDRELPIGSRQWLPYGDHVVRLQGPEIRSVDTILHVTPGMGAQWQTFLTHRESQAVSSFRLPGQPAIQLMSGHSRAPIAPGLSVDRVYIDDVLRVDVMSPYWETHEVLPGKHIVRAVDGLGREEQQALQLGTGPVDIQLLPGVMSDIDGRYRRTLSTVLSPRPADLEVHGDFATWMGRPSVSSMGGSGAMQTRCALTPASSGEWVTVTAVCRFPEPMQSAVVYMRTDVAGSGELQVKAAFEGAALQEWPKTSRGQLRQRHEFRAPRGSSAIRIEARMRVKWVPVWGSARVRFLEGCVFGGHWNDEPPCLAIVADPRDIAQLPPVRPPPAGLAQLPRFGAVVDHGAVATSKGQNAICVAPLPGPAGAVDVLVTVGDQTSKRLEVQRRSWPKLALKNSLSPEQLHDRKEAMVDGISFGLSVAVVGDAADGTWPDVIVGDPSSVLRGATSGGLLGRLSWQSPSPNWLYPPASYQSHAAQGDDQFGWNVMPCGDWNGDGVADVATAAIGYWAGPDRQQVGRVDVVDASNGLTIWQRVGDRPRGALSVADAWGADAAEPATLLLHGVQRPGGTDRQHENYWSLWTGGQAGSESQSIASPPVSVAVLLGALDGSETALIVLNSGISEEMGTGLRRYVARSSGWQLDQEFLLELPRRFAEEMTPTGGLQAVRIGDIDHDGHADAAFVFNGDAYRSGVLFVSSRRLDPLGFTDIQADAAGRCAWIPQTPNTPAQLLVPAGRRLLGVIPK